MEHFLFFRLLFWIALLAITIIAALIIVLGKKWFSREKTLKRNCDA